MPRQFNDFRTLIGINTIQTSVKYQAPKAWRAPLPHSGQLSNLKVWWEQFNDPLLVHLIDSAQLVSPSIASAKSHIEQARSKRTSAISLFLPDLNLNAAASKGLESLFFPPATISALGLATHWEVDVFGGNQAGKDSAQARYASSTVLWHDARVSIAAEVAIQYNSLRVCEAQLAFSKTDADSRSYTARLTRDMSEAGLRAPSDVEMANASSAQANNILIYQAARCDLIIKALVAITGIEELYLRKRLQGSTGKIIQTAAFHVSSIPGDILAQRPDIYSSAYDVIAASADITQLQAQRYPKISFSGKISAMHMELAPSPKGGTVWSVGPLSITLPIFDGGLRVANVKAARARYDEAVSIYASKVRIAVQEVEEALINLQSSDKRRQELRKSADGYSKSLIAKNALYKVGLTSLFELEDIRRTQVQAYNLFLEVQGEYNTALISLYRALGGGWNARDSEDVEAKVISFN